MRKSLESVPAGEIVRSLSLQAGGGKLVHNPDAVGFLEAHPELKKDASEAATFMIRTFGLDVHPIVAVDPDTGRQYLRLEAQTRESAARIEEMYDEFDAAFEDRPAFFDDAIKMLILPVI